MRRGIWLAGTLALAATGATAQDNPFDHVWSVRDVGRGCKAIIRDADFMWDEGGAGVNGKFAGLSWDGGCNANGLIEGTGTLIANATGEFGPGRSVNRGRAVNGLFEGPMHHEDQDTQNESGTWQPWADDGGPRSFDMDMVQGCRVHEGDFIDCWSADAVKVRGQYLASRGGPSSMASSGGGSPGGGSGGSGGAPAWTPGEEQAAAPVAAPRSGPAVSSACAATPAEEVQRFSDEFAAFTRQYPQRTDIGGTRDTYQYTMFFSARGLQLLAPHRACMAPADYAANEKALRDAHAAGEAGCKATTVSAANCVDAYPDNWR